MSSDRSAKPNSPRLSATPGSVLRLNFIGHKYDYSVSLRLPRDANDKGYAGAYLTAKQPRKGESWRRGKDLADGPLTQETLDRITADIANHESKKQHNKSP